jgi:hypothetical protein
MDPSFLLIAMLTFGPFVSVVGILLVAPLALVAYIAVFRFARDTPDPARRYKRWIWYSVGLSLLFAIGMEIVHPYRTSYEIAMRNHWHQYASTAEGKADADRNLTIKGLALRGLLHYGPLALCLAAALGLRRGLSRHD